MIYQAGSSIDSRHPSYIIRAAEDDALQVLRGMRYLQLIEPRQQGKTSLLLRLKRELPKHAFVYIDANRLLTSSEEAWYRSLCSRIVEKLEKDNIISPGALGPSLPTNHDEWDRFIYKLCQATSKPVVLALDEIGVAVFPHSSSFFAVIRAALTSRSDDENLEKVTFALAGAFHPSDLIQDERISPFNVAERVRLPDFTLQEVQELVQREPSFSHQISALAQRIHFWTDGHP